MTAQRLRDYLELTKARLSCLVIVTVAVGFQLAAAGSAFQWGDFALAALGATLAAFGACALNQWWELDWDRQMARTRDRPLPSGRVTPTEALLLAASLLAGGVALLGVRFGLLPAGIALGVTVAYVLVYTPLKRRTPFALLPGAIAGAAPPLIGWTACQGELGTGGWVLFAIVFTWQLPHVAAIDWLHREDAARSGQRTIAVLDPTGTWTRRLAVWGSIALVVAALAPVPLGLAGPVYAGGAALLCAALGILAGGLGQQPTRLAARRLFLASLVHLPLLLALLLLTSPER